MTRKKSIEDVHRRQKENINAHFQDAKNHMGKKILKCIKLIKGLKVQCLNIYELSMKNTLNNIKTKKQRKQKMQSIK